METEGVSYRVHLDGTVECETPEEAIALARVMHPGRPKVARPPSANAFERELRALCDSVPEPPHGGRGPKPLPMSDVLYECAMRVYLRLSAREHDGDIHFNSLLHRMNGRDMSAALSSLLFATRGINTAPIEWGEIMAKKAVAIANEKLLRELVARVVTMSETP